MSPIIQLLLLTIMPYKNNVKKLVFIYINKTPLKVLSTSTWPFKTVIFGSYAPACDSVYIVNSNTTSVCLANALVKVKSTLVLATPSHKPVMPVTQTVEQGPVQPVK